MTLDNFVEADILATCNALGTEINGVYEKGSDCIECLKDILRYLKKDSEGHCILRYLGSIRLLQTDLLPLIKRFGKDKEIFDFTVKILVALTNPAQLLYREDVPDDKISRNIYLQIISFLQSYKKAFADVGVWKVLYEYLKDLLKLSLSERSISDNVLMERIIILIRNVLHVPPDESILKQTDEDLSPHDKILCCINESKIGVLLLYMSANDEEHQYCLHVLEIVSLILREHTAETLANCSETRSSSEKQKDLDALLAAREREQKLKLQQKVQSMYASRFKGVYCVKNVKSLSENDYIAHKLIVDVNDIKFDLNKSARRKPKNRVRAPDVNNARQSTLDIRLFLKNFCIEFLKTYNKLMVSVKRELLRKVSDEHDDTYYLWAISYFMQFNRYYNFQPALVSETISIQSFHHIQTQITNYQEMMLTDKKKALFWAKRMQLGVSAYKELLETLRKMERSEDEIVRDSADALVGHVFYIIEYRELLLPLLSNYDEVKFPLSYLAELVESVQLFLKMLENHSKKHSEIIVQKKQRKVHRRRKKNTAVKEPVNAEEKLNEQWGALASELSAAVFGRREIPDITPFDGASDMTFEEQKIEAVFKIRNALIANKPCEALGLLRAARELWPEGDSFGTADIEPEPEFLILREIHFSNLQKNSQESLEAVAEDSDEEEEDEETEAMATVAEQQLDLNDIYKRYASPKVVQPCSLLLANYRNNKPQTNVCLIKLLHRIAWDCKMYALFFQSTIFLTFQKIFHDPDVNCNPVFKEFYRFSKFIVSKFFAAVEKNKKVYVEFLFWKGAREAYELEEGYGAHENKSKLWTEEEEEELKYLYEENKDVCIDGQDVADIILANFNGKNKTKIQIISALKRLDLIKSAKDLKPEKRTEWTEAEIIELQNLYEDYKNSDDVMSKILDKLTVKRRRKIVVDKLLELNLIQDRKDVRKKSSKNRKKSRHSDSEDNSSDDDNEMLNESYNNETQTMRHEGNLANSESSDDENEREFFRNLEAERIAEDNSAEMNSHSEKKISTHENTKKKKPPKIWEEKEIMELTTLFHENSESDDIIGVLLSALTVKRPKHAIIEKLLEQGLIKDRKDVRKKRSSKEKRNHLMSITKSNSDDNFSDIENSISDSSHNMIKGNKKLHRRILDSSDEDDVPLSHSSVLNDSKRNENSESNVKPPKKKKEEKPWDEQEIIELNNLFIQHKDADDVLNSMVKGLTIKRTQKSITEKMLEIGLIKDKKELKKKASSSVQEVPKKKKQSDLWEEREIVELSRLFQEGKSSNDIMAYILNGLTVKRLKQDVIQKLLEIHLIQDKKEVRKKRATKTLKNKKPIDENDNSDDDDCMNSKFKKKKVVDSSDDEILPLSLISTTISKQKADDLFDSIISTEPPSTESTQQKDPSLGSDTEMDKISNSQKYSKTHDGDQMLSNHDTSFKVTKRKRLVISDSSDDETHVTKHASNENYLLEQDVAVLDPREDSLKENIIPNKQKKKLRILDDSDDSD